MIFSRQLITIFSLAVMLLIFGAGVQAQTEQPDPLPELFSPTPVEEARPVEKIGPEVIRMRSAEVDFSILEQIARSGVRPDTPDFVLNLFEDVHYTANIQKIEFFPSGSVGMVGVVDSQGFSELVLVTRDGSVQATLFVDQTIFEIRFTGNGHIIVEVDQSGYPESPPPLIPDESIQPKTRASDPIIASDPADEIEVLVVYTPAARSLAGGTLAIETKIEDAIISSNTGYASSGIIQRLSLVGMEEVAYNYATGVEQIPPYSWNQSTWFYALNRLTFGHYRNDPNNANYLASARSFRETYGADLVVFVDNLPYIFCGLGWLAGGPTKDYIGYSVVHVNCTGGSSLTVPHELGHNMGACHDWNNSGSGCYFNYSYGYQQLAGGFHTVMAYNPGNSTRINRWSNPVIGYNGYPTSGLVSGQTIYPNNAHTLNNTAINVANYRQSLAAITGSFIQPDQTKRLLIPRVTLSVNAASSEGNINSVVFRAFYDGSWHNLGTDSDGGDGWELEWNATGINPQTISIEAIINDSASNTRKITQSNVELINTHVSTYGFESRSGDKENLQVTEPEPASTAPEQDLNQLPPEQDGAPNRLRLYRPGSSFLHLSKRAIPFRYLLF